MTILSNSALKAALVSVQSPPALKLLLNLSYKGIVGKEGFNQMPCLSIDL
jgi:hypothetical protein